MSVLRILHMIGSLNIGGSQTMILNLYRSIDRSKIQFDFIIDHPDELELADQFSKLGAKIFVMPGFSVGKYRDVKKAWNRFFIEHPEYKILHSHVRSYASIFIPIARKYGVKTIIHSHSTSNGKGWKSLVKVCMQIPLRYQADYFFSCSMEAGKWLFGNRVASGPKHFILKNAIDAANYRFSLQTRTTYRKLLNLEDKRVYIHVGRFHPAKNHTFLLDVFKKIHAQETNAVLLLVGSGELESDIKKQIMDNNLSQFVRLLGNRNDVPSILQAADCFLFPSLWEGLGIVAVEAQAAGLPCICSDQVPELVKVSDRCIFLPFNIEMWRKEALKIIEHMDMYEKIVLSGYDVKATAQWLSSFYQML